MSRPRILPPNTKRYTPTDPLKRVRAKNTNEEVKTLGEEEYRSGGSLDKFTGDDWPPVKGKGVNKGKEWHGAYLRSGLKDWTEPLAIVPEGATDKERGRIEWENQGIVGVSAGVNTDFSPHSIDGLPPENNEWRVAKYHTKSGMMPAEEQMHTSVQNKVKRDGGSIAKKLYFTGGDLEGLGKLESMDIETSEVPPTQDGSMPDLANDGAYEAVDGAASKVAGPGMSEVADLANAAGHAVIDGVADKPKHGVNNSAAAASGAVDGATTGFKIGSNPALVAATGGLSLIAGPLIGGTIGAIDGATGAQKADEEYNKGFQEDYKLEQKQDQPQLFAENGGSLALQYGGGGQLPNDDGNLPGTFNEFHGNTHEEGGIAVGPNAEVETGEVRWEDYIFSDHLAPSNSYTI